MSSAAGRPVPTVPAISSAQWQQPWCLGTLILDRLGTLDPTCLQGRLGLGGHAAGRRCMAGAWLLMVSRAARGIMPVRVGMCWGCLQVGLRTPTVAIWQAVGKLSSICPGHAARCPDIPGLPRWSSAGRLVCSRGAAGRRRPGVARARAPLGQAAGVIGCAFMAAAGCCGLHGGRSSGLGRASGAQQQLRALREGLADPAWRPDCGSVGRA